MTTHKVVVTEPITEAQLPSMPHYFSTLVFREGAGEIEYYELNAKFHGAYRSSWRFKKHWEQVTRRLNTPRDAVWLRTRAVLWRAHIRAENFRPLAVVHLLNKEGTVYAMRHVSGVTVSDSAFDMLLQNKQIRRVSTKDDGSPKEKIRAVIFGLAPLIARVAA
jgi:hypothetical protein